MPPPQQRLAMIAGRPMVLPKMSGCVPAVAIAWPGHARRAETGASAVRGKPLP
jgi:hypothetical protein